VFIDWPVVSVDAQLTAIRHELTHMMERQLAPQASLPAWFNEGNARLEELTIAGTLWYAQLYGMANWDFETEEEAQAAFRERAEERRKHGYELREGTTPEERAPI